MNKEIKTVRDFIAAPGIDDIIENWAYNSNFTENALPDHPRYDDTTYCFSLDDNGCKTLLTIIILDDIVRIETWTVQNAVTSKLAMEQINCLLKTIKQKMYKMEEK